MWVDATQVVPVQGDAMAIKELQNLDRNLASVLDSIAKLRRRKRVVPVMPREIGNDIGHFTNGGTQEKMIVRHFIGSAQTARQLENSADVAFRIWRRGCDIAHTGRTKPSLTAKKRRYAGPRRFILRCQSNGMRCEPHEGPVKHDLTAGGDHLERNDERFGRQPWL